MFSCCNHDDLKYKRKQINNGGESSNQKKPHDKTSKDEKPLGPTSLRGRIMNYSLKIVDRYKTMFFFKKILGMKVLRHTEFADSCNISDHLGGENRWCKTMVGYGPEERYFALELIYNYRIQNFLKGNAFVGITIRDSKCLTRARSAKWPIFQGNILVSPGGYKFSIIDEPSIPNSDPIIKVTLGVFKLKISEEYWHDLLGFQVFNKYSSSNSMVLGLKSSETQLELKQINEPIRKGEDTGRLALGLRVEEQKRIEAKISKANKKILIPLVPIETPGKGKINLLASEDPDGHELYFFEYDPFLALAKFSPKDEKFLKKMMRMEKKLCKISNKAIKISESQKYSGMGPKQSWKSSESIKAKAKLLKQRTQVLLPEHMTSRGKLCIIRNETEMKKPETQPEEIPMKQLNTPNPLDYDKASKQNLLRRGESRIAEEVPSVGNMEEQRRPRKSINDLDLSTLFKKEVDETADKKINSTNLDHTQLLEEDSKECLLRRGESRIVEEIPSVDSMEEQRPPRKSVPDLNLSLVFKKAVGEEAYKEISSANIHPTKPQDEKTVAHATSIESSLFKKSSLMQNKKHTSEQTGSPAKPKNSLESSKPRLRSNIARFTYGLFKRRMNSMQSPGKEVTSTFNQSKGASVKQGDTGLENQFKASTQSESLQKLLDLSQMLPPEGDILVMSSLVPDESSTGSKKGNKKTEKSASSSTRNVETSEDDNHQMPRKSSVSNQNNIVYKVDAPLEKASVYDNSNKFPKSDISNISKMRNFAQSGKGADNSKAEKWKVVKTPKLKDEESNKNNCSKEFDKQTSESKNAEFENNSESQSTKPVNFENDTTPTSLHEKQLVPLKLKNMKTCNGVEEDENLRNLLKPKKEYPQSGETKPTKDRNIEDKIGSLLAERESISSINLPRELNTTAKKNKKKPLIKSLLKYTSQKKDLISPKPSVESVRSNGSLRSWSSDNSSIGTILSASFTKMNTSAKATVFNNRKGQKNSKLTSRSSGQSLDSARISAPISRTRVTDRGTITATTKTSSRRSNTAESKNMGTSHDIEIKAKSSQVNVQQNNDSLFTLRSSLSKKILRPPIKLSSTEKEHSKSSTETVSTPPRPETSSKDQNKSKSKPVKGIPSMTRIRIDRDDRNQQRFSVPYPLTDLLQDIENIQATSSTITIKLKKRRHAK